MKKKLIGHVAVDSGHLMVCDPCYIESEWREKPFEDIRRIEDVMSKRIFEFPKDFSNYEEKIKGFNQTVNQFLVSGRFKELDDHGPAPFEFSYDGSCKAANSPESAGEMRFHLRRAGAGVAFSSGYGDGVYPVYAFYNKDGRIVKVEIRMN